jgi:L-Ala-D/L-Glu epimerase
MCRVMQVDLLAVDLPFKRPFRHAAASRTTSESLFVKCMTETGSIGFGESLPRHYVTGESRESAFALLQSRVLPHLVGLAFTSMEELYQFLQGCDGRAPAAWVDCSVPQSAAWCAVELALLDAFGRAFRQPVQLVGPTSNSDQPPYSGVVSASTGVGFRKTLLMYRLYGLKQIKLKVAKGDVSGCVRIARKWLGRSTQLRIDANMAWSVDEALQQIGKLRQLGVQCIEQPLRADDLAGAGRLVRESHAQIIADESFSHAQSLKCLLDHQACTGLNVRISKCGGLIAAKKRCEDAEREQLTVQIGCQVGESSLLSAAQLLLVSAVPQANYLEGCFSTYLLREDPVQPGLKFGYRGRRPRSPAGFGLAIEVNEQLLNRCVTKRASTKRTAQTQTEGKYHVDTSQVAVFSDRPHHGKPV